MGEDLKRVATVERLKQGKGKFCRKADGRAARVMGVLEGYVVARFRGAAPFVMIRREFLDKFEAAE